MLILGGFLLFQSQTYQRFYYNKILKQPYPVDSAEKQKKEGTQTVVVKERKDSKNETLKETTFAVKDSIQKSNDTIATTGDTIWVETDKLILGISEIGAKAVSYTHLTLPTNREV